MKYVRKFSFCHTFCCLFSSYFLGTREDNVTNSIIGLDTTKSIWTDTPDGMQYARKQHACILARYRSYSTKLNQKNWDFLLLHF